MASKNKEQRNIAVVGAGGWGKNLIRNFSELGVLKTICDIREEILKERKKDYPTINFSTAYEEILNDSDITGVVISAPAETHFALAKKSLLAQKNTYVEKPLALKLEEAEELISLAEDAGLILMVGHILRYHTAINKLKELIDSGELGKIQYIYSNRLNIGKIRTEENILWSFAPHDISVILYLLGEEPTSIIANGGNYLQKDIADVTLTVLEFEGGVKSHIFVSWLHPFKEQKLVVVGDKKMGVFDDLTDEKLFLYPHKIEWRNRIPVAQKAKAETVSIEAREPLKLECQHFLDCINNGKQPITDGFEGLRVLKVLTAAQKSMNQGGARIKISRKNSKDDYYVHPTSSVGENCTIGKGTKIWNHSQIQSGAILGENCVIGHNCFVGEKAKLGNGVKLESNIDVWDLVTLEDYVFVGPSAVFTNDINPRAQFPKKKFPQFGKWIPTLVKRGASIGANATIVCGTTIGKCAMIGAGAVVTKDIADYSVAAGVPAKVIGYICECGNKLDIKNKTAMCQKCSRKYKKKNQTLIQEKS